MGGVLAARNLRPVVAIVVLENSRSLPDLSRLSKAYGAIYVSLAKLCFQFFAC